MNWQPIETAPKDGTKILLKLRDSDVSHSGYYKIRYGWRIAWDDHDLSEHDGPTHWMPLPPAPGHDLSSVVVVDAKAIEGVKRAMKSALATLDYYANEGSQTAEDACRKIESALASLKATGEG